MSEIFNDLDNITAKLDQICINQTGGVSFCERSLKLDSADHAKEIVDTINSAKSVHFINLAGNSLGVEAAEAIGHALESRSELQVAIWKDLFTGRLSCEIPKALKFLSKGLMTAGAKLRVLNVSDNAFGPTGIEGLEDLLRSPVCYSLQELYLNNVGLGISGAKTLAKALMDLYENCKNNGTPLELKVLDAGRNRLENEGGMAISEVLMAIGSLEELILPQNGIYHRGVQSLSSAILGNPNLRKIDLNDNILSIRGSLSIALVLPYLKNLKDLNIGDCLVRDKGAKLLAESLKKLTQLEVLDMSHNELRKDVSIEVLNSVPQNCRLALDGNCFKPQAIDEILQLGASRCIQLSPIEYPDDDESVSDDPSDDESSTTCSASSEEEDSPKSIESGSSNVSCKSEAGSDRSSRESASLTSEETSSEYTTSSSSGECDSSTTSTSDNDTSISSLSSHYSDCRNIDDFQLIDSPQVKSDTSDANEGNVESHIDQID